MRGRHAAAGGLEDRVPGERTQVVGGEKAHGKHSVDMAENKRDPLKTSDRACPYWGALAKGLLTPCPISPAWVRKSRPVLRAALVEIQ